MSVKNQTVHSPVARGVSTSGTAVGKALRRTSRPTEACQDRRLIEGCLQGDAPAWDRLYACCHPALLTAIRVHLGARSQDLELVDEIAARVWYQLVRREAQLLAKFDPYRGCRLVTYLGVLARNEVRTYLRAERRRKLREAIAARSDDTRPSGTPAFQLQDFLATLTPRETAFLDWCLGRTRDHQPASFSPTANGDDQLRHRIREKITAFFRS